MNPMGAPEVWLESATGQRSLIRGSCFLGRAPMCEVVLANAKVSRQHALINRQGEGEFWLIDLGSSNGTYLNGRRVAQPCRLSNGDQIRITGFAFHFRHPQARTHSEDTTPSEATVLEVRHLTCWLLVADIQGSTQLLRKVPLEAAHRTTGLWLAACRKILKQHHGTINKFLGDGFLAYWPDEAGCPESITSTLLALKTLQDAGEPSFRLVLHYGTVSAGGYASLGEENLTGNEVNFVFRLEKLAGTLGISRLLSEPANNRIKHLLATVPEGEHLIPDFAQKFSFFSF